MPRKPLAQQVGTTADVSMYQPSAGIRVVAGELKVNNNTTNNLTFRVYHDIDGTTFAAANAIAYDEPILANTTKTINIPSIDENGAIAIRASANTSLTFTLYGQELTDPNEKILAQRRDANTTAQDMYSPAAGIRATGLKMIITNTAGTDQAYRIFQHDGGTTKDETTAVAWDIPIPADTRQVVNLAPMSDPSGSIGVRTDLASALTFTLYGVEQTIP